MILYAVPSKNRLSGMVKVSFKGGGAIGRLIIGLMVFAACCVAAMIFAPDESVRKNAQIVFSIITIGGLLVAAILIHMHPESVLEGEHLVAYTQQASKNNPMISETEKTWDATPLLEEPQETNVELLSNSIEKGVADEGAEGGSNA